MTENEERRAMFWIRRWKMIGGGFRVDVREGEGERLLAVTILRGEPPSDPPSATDRAADAMAQELVKDTKKHLHIGELVRDAWVRANPAEATVESGPPTPANDVSGT